MAFVPGTEIVSKRNTQIGSIIETSYLVINQTDELQKQSLLLYMDYIIIIPQSLNNHD
jgi:hypothetical protein